MRVLTDGYPLADDASDFDIQLNIDAYLAGPINERSFLPTAARVTAAAGKATKAERYAWLMPLLRRAEWLREHPMPATPHAASHLMCTAGLLLNHNREQTEEELLTLLHYTALFRQTEENSGLGEIVSRAVEAFRKTSQKAVWVAALESACFELEQMEAVHGGRFAAALGLALVADPAAAPSPSPCWSSVIVEALPKLASAADWRACFALADTHLLFPREPKEKQVAAAIKKIGADEFAARLNEWTTPVADDEVYLSWRGVALLKVLLHGATEVAGAAVQPALSAIAAARWRQPERAKLIVDALVRAAGRQPQAFAQACLVTLAAQPYAADNAALKVAVSKPSHDVIGVDGFPLDTRPEHIVFHHRLDQWLRGKIDLLHARAAAPDLHTLALSENGADYLGLFRAMLDRFFWFAQHQELLPDRQKYLILLGGRFAELLPLLPPLDRDDLTRLMQADTQGILYCGGPGQAILERIEQHLEAHSFDAELLTAVEAWHKSLYGTTSKQALRRHAGLLLWRESTRPADFKSCWSACIRQDLRDMPEAQRQFWRELLSHVSFQVSGKPGAKWKKAVADVLKRMGRDEFAARFHKWLRPLGEDQPLPLEATGADVLRCLFWAAAGVEDARVEEALAWFPKAPWKSKKARGYTAKLTGPYVYALSGRAPDLVSRCLDVLVERGGIPGDPKNANFAAYKTACEQSGHVCREGIAPPPPPTAADFLLNSLRKLADAVNEDTITVQGQIDAYVIDRKSNEVRRKSDNAVVRLDYGTSPEAELMTQLANMPTIATSPEAQAISRTLRLARMFKMDRQFARFIRVSSGEPTLQ